MDMGGGRMIEGVRTKDHPSVLKAFQSRQLQQLKHINHNLQVWLVLQGILPFQVSKVLTNGQSTSPARSELQHLSGPVSPPHPHPRKSVKQ